MLQRLLKLRLHAAGAEGGGGARARSTSSLLPRGRDGAEESGEPRLACLPPRWPPVVLALWPEVWLMGSKVTVVDFLCL